MKLATETYLVTYRLPFIPILCSRRINFDSYAGEAAGKYILNLKESIFVS